MVAIHMDLGNHFVVVGELQVLSTNIRALVIFNDH